MKLKNDFEEKEVKWRPGVAGSTVVARRRPREVAWDYLSNTHCPNKRAGCPHKKSRLFLRHLERQSRKPSAVDSLHRYRLTDDFVTEEDVLKKAEYFFKRCEFEASLVMYERGLQRWPKKWQFWTGAKRSREAILSLIGKGTKKPFQEVEKLKPFIETKSGLRPTEPVRQLILESLGPEGAQGDSIDQGDQKMKVLSSEESQPWQQIYTVRLGGDEAVQSIQGTAEDIANYMLAKKKKLRRGPHSGVNSLPSRTLVCEEETSEEEKLSPDRSQMSEPLLPPALYRPHKSASCTDLVAKDSDSVSTIGSVDSEDDDRRSVSPDGTLSLDGLSLSKSWSDRRSACSLADSVKRPACTVGVTTSNLRIVEEVWRGEVVWNQPGPHIIKGGNTKKIEQLLRRMFLSVREGKQDKAVDIGLQIVDFLRRKTEEELPGRRAYIIPTYSILALSYLQRGRFSRAMKLCMKMKRVAEILGNITLLTLALAVKAQAHVKAGQLDQAALTWEEMIPLLDENNARAWLFHELGRCYFHLHEVWVARKYCAMCREAARSAGNRLWIMNAEILMAHTELEIGDYNSALTYLRTARNLSQSVGNKRIHDYIVRAENMITTSGEPVVCVL